MNDPYREPCLHPTECECARPVTGRPHSPYGPDDHDHLIDAYAHLTNGGLAPTPEALAEITGLPVRACAAWMTAGMIWNG